MKTILRLASVAFLAVGISLSGPVCNSDHPCRTPEVNPATGMNALALLAGAGLVIRNKFKK